MWYLIFTLMLPIILMLWKYNRSRKVMLANKIPGPVGSFIIGMLPVFLKDPTEIFPCMAKIYRKYEKTLFKIWTVHKLFIIVTQPEDIEFVLTNPKLLKKSDEYEVFSESIMGQGIFTIQDIKKWKNNRKMVTKGFSVSILKTFIPVFYEEASVLAEKLIQNSDVVTNECEISYPISMATLEMIGRTSLGVTFNAQNDNGHLFVENLYYIMKVWYYRITHPWYINKYLFQFSSVKRKHDRSQEIINSFVDDMIKKKLNEFNQNASTKDKMNTDVDCETYSKHHTFMDILLENSHEMSLKQIRQEIVTIMIGGQDTTAFVNACIIFMLAHHQNVQKKVFEELESIFMVGDYNRQPTYEDLQQMEYLEMVIKETLRLFPSLPFYSRQLNEDMQIGKHLCPAGSTLVTFPFFLHSSPQFYTDPETFNPENFLPDTNRSRHPYTFLPFSSGIRNCIGIRYAMLQMKTVTSTLIRKNTFHPSDKCPTPKDMKLMLVITLKIADGCFVRVVPRTS